MTQLLEPPHDVADLTPARVRHAPTARQVRRRRFLWVGSLLLLVGWSLMRARPADGGEVVNSGGVGVLSDLLAQVLSPALDPDFLALVAEATATTLAFATLGTIGALVIGLFGGLILSDIAWSRRPPAPVRALRLALRGVLVAVRSIHELIWALLLVSVLGLDPLVAVLALALPFGAQTAQVFGETFDDVHSDGYRSLRAAGARRLPAICYALLPAASPILLSYSFYRFECAIRSTVLLGVVGVGGLGQELVVSLQSRNWSEVWTLVAVLLMLSALVDLWSGAVRARLGGDRIVEPDAPGGEEDSTFRVSRDVPAPTRSWITRISLTLVVPGVVLAWVASEVSLSGLTDPRTLQLTTDLLGDMWPPQLPGDSWATLSDAMLDTIAMAVLAMLVAVATTIVLAPWSARTLPSDGRRRPWALRAPRTLLRLLARLLLLVLRAVPPTVWAVIALLAFFPGIVPGAIALGLYTGGILGRLVAEAWEGLDVRPRDALVRTGVSRSVAGLAAVTPGSVHHLVTYTLYRFEICVRDTAVVGVVGAAGLGRLFAEALAGFRFPVVATLLLASLALSLSVELLSRRIRRSLRS